MALGADILKIVRAALAEDLGKRKSDITTAALVPKTRKARAVIRAREPGVVAGLEIAQMAFKTYDPLLKVRKHVKNGAAVQNGQVLMSVEGRAASILTAERTALNFLTHLSGIATLTRHYVDAVRGTQARILDTRKTHAGLRMLEKYAVKAGGGVNHRFGLYDSVLIKDNHIAIAGGIGQALDKVKRQKGRIEIEVDTIAQLEEVLRHGGADVVLLDNMNVAMLTRAVVMAKGKILTEASGGVNLKNIRAIARTGVDFISVGALTHSAPAMDIGLDIHG